MLGAPEQLWLGVSKGRGSGAAVGRAARISARRREEKRGERETARISLFLAAERDDKWGGDRPPLPRATPDLAGRRGGSGGLPPTIPSLARFCPR